MNSTRSQNETEVYYGIMVKDMITFVLAARFHVLLLLAGLPNGVHILLLG